MNQQDLVLVKNFTEPGEPRVLVFECANYSGEIYVPEKSVWLSAANHVPGIFDYAIEFNSYAYIEVPDSQSLDITDEFSMEAWIMIKQLRPLYSAVLQKGYDGAENYELLVLYDGRIEGAWMYDAGRNQVFCTSNALEIGKWYHVVVTSNPGGTRVYVNGTMWFNSSSTYGKMVPNDKPLWIGNEELLRERCFDGIIDEVRIYNRALTEEEVQYNMNNPQDPVKQNLVLWLGMDEKSEVLVKDYSGQGNDGTLTKFMAPVPTVDLMLGLLEASWFNTHEYAVIVTLTGETLELGHAELVSYKQVSPVEWEATVNSEGPFFLIFTEKYENAWKAYVNGEECRHFNAYGFSNAFYVEHSGLVNVKIYYKVQDFFYIGYAITLLTLSILICISLLESRHALHHISQE
jgi:hypothetical protein